MMMSAANLFMFFVVRVHYLGNCIPEIFCIFGFLKLVQPIIQRNVQPGSLIYTDEWAAYRRMQRVLGFNHQTVNHSVNFVDPVTGVHTQHAESNCSVAEDKFKKMKGNTNPNFLQEYLKEFMWRRWHGEPHPNGSFRGVDYFCREVWGRQLIPWSQSSFSQ